MQQRENSQVSMWLTCKSEHVSVSSNIKLYSTSVATNQDLTVLSN